MNAEALKKELEILLNKHSAENNSGTPDFILANYLLNCLVAYDVAVEAREKWYGRDVNLIHRGLSSS